jgi:hypothetical protein
MVILIALSRLHLLAYYTPFRFVRAVTEPVLALRV